MKPLNDKDYKLFESLVGLSQLGLKKTMAKFLKQRYEIVYNAKDFIYAVGDIPVALVAHMDTVFDKPADDVFYDREKTIMWSPQGLGADDRAGIFAIIKVLQSGLKPSIILTTDEEKGGLGAEEFIKQFPEPKSQINYLIQLDRRGSNDCVFYDCDNENFVKYVENFGFAENFGSFSDISVICPEWRIAGVNLSVGYLNEHNYIETLNTTHLLQTISKVKRMLSADIIPSFEYIPCVYSGYYKYMRDFDWFDKEEYVCRGCGKKFSEYEILLVKSKDNPLETVCYCPDCCVTHVNWCLECNAGFEVDENLNDQDEYAICPECQTLKKINVTGNKNNGFNAD